MKLLFINPNRYHHPPVIPLGIEYLAGSLSETNHEYAVLDLCFSPDPAKDIRHTFEEENPEIIGISIRQIDTVLYHNNRFFLEEIRDIVELCKGMKSIVLLGGSGFSIMPKDILDFAGADYGIYGPGEIALINLLDGLENSAGGNLPDRIIDGYRLFKNKTYDFKRKHLFDYTAYFDKEGIAGFRTQIGCTDRCIFCTEGAKPLIFHNPDSVGMEIAKLKNRGFSRFHLCDSEFNLRLDKSIEVCRAIKRHAGKIDWTLYMKPEPFSEELFRCLKESGASLITLSLDTVYANRQNLPKLENFFTLSKQNNIDIAVDLSTGFPYEDVRDVRRVMDFLDSQPLKTIGVNSYYRLYPGTPLYRQIRADAKLKRYVIGDNPGGNFLYPVFFNYFSLDLLHELVDGRERYRIEGFEQAVNYQRSRSEI